MITPIMTYAKHLRALMLLGLPLMGGHLTQFLIGVTDSAMLGRYSVDALAAVTLASGYFFVLFLLGAGFAFAVMPMVANFEAEGDHNSIRRVTRMGMWLSVMYFICCLPFLLFSETIFLLLKQAPHIAAAAQEYLRIAGFGMMAVLATVVIKSYLAALERTQVIFWITLIAAISNGLFNYALIFGNWGAPELGIRGAAIASVLTQCLMLIGVIIYAHRAFPAHKLFQRLYKVDGEMLKKVFALGVPIGLTGLSETGMFTATAILMGWLGTIPLAAHGVALNCAGLTFMLHLGLSNAATVRAGNAMGRKDIFHLLRGAKVVVGVSVALSLVMSCIFLIWPKMLILLFIESNDPARDQIAIIGVQLLAMAAIFQMVDGMQIVMLGLLRGLQDAKIPMVFCAISYWIVGMPTAYAFGFVFDYQGIGIWLGLVVGLACAAGLLSWRFWRLTKHSAP